jgi:tetratricopeptide (TPR) repeat protein
MVQHDGLAAGLAHLEAAASQIPHHYGLRRLWVEWGRDRDPTAAEPVVRALLGLAPSDAWARRELVVILDKAGRHDEAHREAEEAARIEPRNSYSHSILGHACQSLGRRPESRSHFVRAIELSVDNDDALRALLDLARTDEERKRDLGFIEQQLLRQVVTGDGLLAFMELARPILDPETLLQSLRLAHAERPDLWHAWSALGSQLAHLGHLDEATEVARQATDRFPHLPRIWLDLAQAHRLRNAPQEEIAAARRAVEINPAWSVSALALADALERAGSMADAHAVYERALMHLADDAQVHAMHAHLLWRQRKPSEALDAVERALRLAPGYGWAWNVLNEWAIACGQPMRPFEFAHLLARESPGDRHIWLALTRLTDGPETLAERLAAVDKALALDAHWVDAWDMKAVLLVEAERFDEAAAACEVGMPLCPVDAHILQGRRAWIESQRCQLPEAIERMRTILAENASYAWGWSQLARWLVEQDELAEATLALKHLRRLRPHDPWVYRQLGELHLRQEDRQGTREAFAMALRLSPADVAAAHHIFDLQVQSGDLVEAENTLRIMQMHQPGAQTLAAEIQLRLREKDVPAAIKLLQSLSVSTDPAPWPLNAAAEAFRHAGRSRQALRTLRRTLRNEESCNPQTGAAAIRLLLDGGRATAATWLFLKICRPEIQRRAAAPLVKALAQRRCRCLLWCLLWRCREALANDDDAWAQVGYALVSIGSMKKAAQWLDDWQTRANVQPWVLFDLCLALRKLGRCDEANEIAEHVVRTWAHREGAADMRLFLAVEAALAGTLQVAAEHLRLVVVRDQVAYDQEMLALAKELLDFQMAKPEDRPRQFKALRIRLDKRFSPWQILTKRGDVRNTFRRAGRVFVSEGGGWPARLWVCWKLNWQWLVLPFAPLLLLLLLQPASWVVFLMWYAATGRTRINTPAN